MMPPLLPMLAASGEPFDSPEHLFEVKWDGVRALAAVERRHWQLWGRDLADYQPRYPELEVLRRLPGGTVVDGELVVFQNGRAQLATILHRHARSRPGTIRMATARWPVTYLLFDLVGWQGRLLVDRPLTERRARLEELLRRLQEPRLAFSAGIVGPGREFFEKVVAQGHEGVMAKYLASRYLPGRRVSSWRKIKPRRTVPAVILGYTSNPHGLHSLLVGIEQDGVLRYAATVTAGLSPEARRRMMPQLVRRIRTTPLVRCPQQATWVEPELYCQVRYLDQTAQGHLRHACFLGLFGETD